MSGEMKVAIVGAVVAGIFTLLAALIEVFGAEMRGWIQDSNQNTYAILYEDGTLVFQHGSHEDESKRAARIYRVNLDGYSCDQETAQSSVPWYPMRNKIQKVSFDDRIQPKSTLYWFFDCRNLDSIEGILRLDTSQTSDMRAMFRGCNSLTELDVRGFDTSSVTDMSDMFYDCNRLMTLDVSGFDTSSVTDMSGMFQWCMSLNGLDVRKFDTSSVTDMSDMFGNCASLATLDVSRFDTSHVVNMSGMFAQCGSLATLDVSRFDTSLVTDMHSMFDGCENLVTIYASNSFTVDQVQYSERMFAACYSLKGENGTAVEYAGSYDNRRASAKYAHIDGGASNPGYFTAKH